jgi:hypothetical protein
MGVTDVSKDRDSFRLGVVRGILFERSLMSEGEAMTVEQMQAETMRSDVINSRGMSTM